MKLKSILCGGMACAVLLFSAACGQMQAASPTGAATTAAETAAGTSAGAGARTGSGYARISTRTESANSAIHADMIYQTTTMSGIASVSDTVAIGTFTDISAGVESGGIATTGTFHVQRCLFGDCGDRLVVSMGGGTIPFRDIDQLYGPEELEKYHLDPNHPDRETYTTTFEGMPVFRPDVTYLVTLKLEEDGRYILLPSSFSLCPIADAPPEEQMLLTASAAENQPADSIESLDGNVFSIDEYLEVFQSVHQAGS